MGLSILFSRARDGIRAPEVSVEVHSGTGLPRLSIVGLPEAAVRESKDRVRGAIQNSDFKFPPGRVTINLAPADLPKEGGRFDLAIALGILGASGEIQTQRFPEHEFLGELALDGRLRPISAPFTAALAARDAGRALVLPSENAAQAALIPGLQVLPAKHLLEVCGHLNGHQSIVPLALEPATGTASRQPELSDVRGQEQSKRALEIAAAGAHNLLLIGPPGTGKSMLANRLPGLLPPLSEAEAIESAAIRSASQHGELDPNRWRERPFRAPHHTASGIALVGGGANPRPGEISLAHLGVLFLDELPEFERRVLEVLREPLESGQIRISRAARQADFPARFQLIAAMNPCPCGYLGDTRGRCRCTSEQVSRYRNRISGPLLDRFDLQVEVPRLPAEQLACTVKEPINLTEIGDKSVSAPLSAATSAPETSAQVRARVLAARQRQQDRAGRCNGALSAGETERYCQTTPDARTLLARAIEQLALSGRAYHRILRVARTIADLEAAEICTAQHLSEAIGYRRLDRDID